MLALSPRGCRTTSTTWTQITKNSPYYRQLLNNLFTLSTSQYTQKEAGERNANDNIKSQLINRNINLRQFITLALLKLMILHIFSLISALLEALLLPPMHFKINTTLLLRRIVVKSKNQMSLICLINLLIIFTQKASSYSGSVHSTVYISRTARSLSNRCRKLSLNSYHFFP